VVNRRLIAIAITVGLAAAASAQQTQTLRDRDPDIAAARQVAADLQRANFHNGPWYLLSRIRIADAGFSEGAYVPTGDSEGSFSLKIEAPNRLYFVPRKKTVYSLQVTPSYSFFREGARDGQFDFAIRGDAQYLLNHLYLDVYGATSDQLEAHVADINRVATVRENELGVAGEVKYSSRTSGQFILRVRDTEYPEERFQPDPHPEGVHIPTQVLDRREQNVRLSMLHKTFPRTSLFVAGEGSNYDFDNVARYSSRRTYAGGGLQYEAGRTTVRVEAGPMKLDFDDESMADYEGLTARFGTTRTAGRWGYRLNANRDIGFSLFLDNAYYVATQGELGVDYSANRRLTLHARTAYERDEFETPVNGRQRTDDVSFSSVGFTYLFRKAAVGADIGWYERDSTAYGDVASGIRYVVRLSLTP
jgi:hypothetical protein